MKFVFLLLVISALCSITLTSPVDTIKNQEKAVSFAQSFINYHILTAYQTVLKAIINYTDQASNVKVIFSLCSDSISSVKVMYKIGTLLQVPPQDFLINAENSIPIPNYTMGQEFELFVSAANDGACTIVVK